MEAIITSPQFRVRDLAQQLDIASAQIIGMLKNRGFKEVARPSQLLAEEHIETIFKVYSDATKRVLQKFQAKKKYSKEEYEYYKKYFSSFIQPKEHYKLQRNTVKSWELDEELLRVAFNNLIFSKRSQGSGKGKAYGRVIFYLLIAIRVAGFDLKNLLNSIIPPKLFFIYTNDDDEQDAYNLKIGLSN